MTQKRHQLFRSPQGTIYAGLAMLAFWTTVGTLGFMALEGWEALDSLYMTVITISTVGFREISPLSDSGKLFAVVLIIGGLGTAFYTFTRLGQALMEGELMDIFGRRRMTREVKNLSNHFILCGYGRVGRTVAAGLDHEGHPFCVIDSEPKLEEELRAKEFLYVIGDATDERILEQTGVRDARSLLALLPSDADNLYLTMAAKDLNPKLRVLARASDERAEMRITRGGADVVVSPHRIAGQRVLQAAVKPTVVEFMELVTHREFISLGLGEALIEDHAPVKGQTIAEANIRRDYGLIIVAIKRTGGAMIFNPDPSTTILKDDILVVIGKDNDILRLKGDCADDFALA